jgi:hypothetical protein
MTTERDFDRIARAWLDASPDEVPDRVIAAVLQAVDATPQVRSPWRWLPWRLAPMNRIPLALGAAAIVAVTGALVLSRSGLGPDVGTSPTPESSISPSGSPGAAGAPVPTELRARWMGDHRGVVAPDAGTTIVLDQSTFALTQSNAESERRLASSASSVGDGQIRLESTATANDCTKGDVGVYRWLLTSSGRTLTITEDSDACPTRAGALAGTWWLMGCPLADDFCLGPLDAGTYMSQYIGPRVNPGATWTPEFGALTYTVPDGWANSYDWPTTFGLIPAAELPPFADSSRTRQIGLVTQPTAMAQDRPCSDAVAPGVNRTVNALTTWLPTVPGLVTTKPTTITIDGHSGQWLDLSIDAGWKRTCDGETKPIIAFLNPGTAIGGTERERLILLDLGDGDVLAIVVWASDQAAFDALVPEAMPIVESFRFK